MQDERSDRLASKVTVGVGAGIPRVFKNVRVDVDYGHAVVEIRADDAPRTHIASAPLGATLIEWHVSPPARHRITVERNARAHA